MKERYVEDSKFNTSSIKLIRMCDAIITDYGKQGYRLTIRQLYYQLVARGHIENTVRSYNNVVGMMTKARLAGLIDWDAIEDRTRDVIQRAHWTSGGHLLRACAEQYFEDMWQDQEYRVFVMVEKEALAGVLEPVCHEWDCPLLPARGYPSATTLREFAKQRILNSRQRIVVLHLGDHDPSGMDMSRDLSERLSLFSRERVDIDFRRIALNMDQVEEQQPPPNPAKSTDTRFDKYEEEFGDESWELDALSPAYLNELVSNEVQGLVNHEVWATRTDKIEKVRERLTAIAEDFDKDE